MSSGRTSNRSGKYSPSGSSEENVSKTASSTSWSCFSNCASERNSTEKVWFATVMRSNKNGHVPHQKDNSKAGMTSTTRYRDNDAESRSTEPKRSRAAP